MTATVDNVSLIASSIMGKKLASGSDNIVLDVKYGSGAFMKTSDDAELLAKTMVEIGKRNGRQTVALITDMDDPLGNYVGNRLEVWESIKVLKNEFKGDLREICVELSANMVSICKKTNLSEAKKIVEDAIESGKAFDKFCEWISCQGGDLDFLFGDEFTRSNFSFAVKSEKDGFISKSDTEKIGKAACILGAGRTELGGSIDFTAGIRIEKKPGDYVNKGETLATFYSSTVNDFTAAKDMYISSFEFSDVQPNKKPLIYKTIK